MIFVNLYEDRWGRYVGGEYQSYPEAYDHVEGIREYVGTYALLNKHEIENYDNEKGS